ncbi:hypothetical protein ACX80E_08115 [Arthrobacter sp. TMN-49]
MANSHVTIKMGTIMKKSFRAIALTFLLAGVLSGCSSSGGNYSSLDELQAAIESAGVDCSSDDTGSEAITGGGQGKTCNDSYVMYMFDSPEDKQKAIDFYGEMQAGVIVTHILDGKDWYVVGGNEASIKDIKGKIGGKATTMTGD